MLSNDNPIFLAFTTDTSSIAYHKISNLVFYKQEWLIILHSLTTKGLIQFKLIGYFDSFSAFLYVKQKVVLHKNKVIETLLSQFIMLLQVNGIKQTPTVLIDKSTRRLR